MRAMTAAVENQEGSGASSSSGTRDRYRFQWYQSYDSVSVEVFVKGTKQMPEGKVRTRFTEKSLCLEVDDGHASGGYKLELNLRGEIVPEETRVELLSTKVEVKLKKKESGSQWEDLEEGQGEVGQGGPNRTMAAASSLPGPGEAALGAQLQHKKKSPKDWAALEAELAELEKEDKPEGEQALQALFKDIYSKADEDTQRAMMKSFQESNGTVLSTNWNEVGKKKVEIQAPDGMTPKRYEQ